MGKLRSSSVIIGLTAFSAIPALSAADIITIRRDNVIPVILEDKLTISDNRVGDQFTVRVADDSLLPKGTELLGRIEGIHPAKGKRASSMDLKFFRILMPDNSRINLDAAVIPLDDRWVTRNGDGRLVAKQDIRKQQNDVLGGAIGGFIVGSIFHRRITGTIIGTIAGVAAAENDRAKDNNLIASQGDKLGALVNREVVVDVPDSRPRERRYGRGDRGVQNPVRTNDQASRTHYNDPGAPIVINFGHTDMQFPSDARPYWIGETLMVPLEPAANQMGLDVDRRPDRVVYIDSKDNNLRLTVSSRQARINGDNITLPRTVVEHDGVLYAPLDALVLMTKEPVLLNGTKYAYKS